MAFKVIDKDTPISNDEVLKKLFDKIERERKRGLYLASNDTQSLKGIHRERMSGDNLIGKGGAKWRRVARIHPMVYHAIIQKYGANALKDKDLLKEIMSQPEMQAFLTVPLKEL